MSLSSRAAALKPRNDDLASLAGVHRNELRALKLVWDTVQHNNSLHSLLNAKLDPDSIPDDEAVFLQKNDISTGFDTSTLTLRSPPSTPAPQTNDATFSESKPTSTLAESSQHARHLPEPVELAGDAAPSSNTTDDVPPEPVHALTVPESTASPAPVDGQPAVHSAASPRESRLPESPSIAPVQVAPPMPEEEAVISDSVQKLVDQQATSKPAKTAHLPSEEVQEQRYSEREAEVEEHHRQSDNESKALNRQPAAQTEVASSPSSTVGAHSAATPQPAQDSPDTSPDSDTAQVEILPPKDLQPTPEQRREKEEHDRLLEAQKEIARKQALGDVGATPDEQLRWEAREAAAREASERAAREEIGGPESNAKGPRDSTEAEQVMEELDVDATLTEPLSTVKTASPVKEERIPDTDPQDDEDTISVAPRRKSPQSPTDARQSDHSSETPKLTTPASSRPERMTTRVSSGALRQKSVSEILGHPQLPFAEPSPSTRRQVSSPEPISPLTQRHSHDSASLAPLSNTSRFPRPLSVRTSSAAYPALDQLDVLKGAAEDPERDYLEPLFRIQAHESPNSGTKTLPELIRMVPKALSTEDHFTSLHERLDFRMLRRIYQLQNANKWSLRQMEKCKEPEQPVTHHDHMMEEMKWMRKDFKAERKMKKSVCAWLAQRCAEWVSAGPIERKRLQVGIKLKQPTQSHATNEVVPDLEHAGDSAPEDDMAPPTPRANSPVQTTIVVAPDLAGAVEELRSSGKFDKALVTLPKTGLLDRERKLERPPLTMVSKFVDGKVLPKTSGPTRKRSRYDYDDEAEALESQATNKRRRDEDYLPPESQACALFDPENKGIRERLHSNSAFRPPSEFLMPSTYFYEFRSGSQWIWEDDQKLRKLAKDYSFNWSLIADEVALPTRFKSSAERRTPWECFERWVELDGLPADMRKTLYFKTWFQRLESSQQAAERRYQAQVSVLQQQAAQMGSQAHIPIRRRTVPTRVEKRRSTRYLWMVDGFRKLAKKREQAAWKQAETARAAAQRKTQSEANQVKTVRMTPQEFSKKRQERDQQMLEQQRLARANMIEAQKQRAAAMARANQPQQQPQQQNGLTMQQRQQGAIAAKTQQVQQAPTVNGQSQGQAPGQQQLRPSVQTAPQRNGHLAPPQVNVQGIPQAQMRAGIPPNMQMAQNNAQTGNGQSAHYTSNMQSPGGNMTTQQYLAQNQALLQAAYQQQQQRQTNGGQVSNLNQQMVSSPNMAPPPTPQNVPQQLSSGHVPQIIAIQNQLRAANPGLSEEQLKALATQQMKAQSQSTSQARQNAISAAAGISPQPNHAGMQYNQASYQRNSQQMGMNGMYNMGTDGNGQQVNAAAPSNNGSPQSHYAQKMWQRQHQMMHNQNSPNMAQAQLNGSPGMAPASPSMAFSNMGQQMGTPGVNMNGQRPPSRSATPQVRLGSAGNAMGNGIQSPGALQGSPVQANMAR